MASASRSTEELPSPESDILRSRFFVRFQTSGGPHLDALLYNQGTIMKLIQDIRLIQSRNIGVGGAADPDAGPEGDKVVPKFAEEVKALLGRKVQADLLSGMMKNWLAADKVNNKIAGNRCNKRLATWSQSFWDYCKQRLAQYWDREDDQWNMDEEDDVFYKDLINSLKIIDDSSIDVEELFYLIGKKAVDKPPVPGTKRTRTTGASAVSGTSSTPAAAAADSADSDNSEPIRAKRTRHGGRGALGGDATEEIFGVDEDEDDFILDYDDLYPSEDERLQMKHATIRRRELEKRKSDILKEAKASGDWTTYNELEIEDEEETTQARLASLTIG